LTIEAAARVEQGRQPAGWLGREQSMAGTMGKAAAANDSAGKRSSPHPRRSSVTMRFAVATVLRWSLAVNSGSRL
jgi:hypothetical protein